MKSKIVIPFLLFFLGGWMASVKNGYANKKESMKTWVNVGGVESILAEKHDQPLVSFIITFPFGAYTDPDDKGGLTNLLGEMLMRGTVRKSREEIENTLDFLGANLDIDAGSHSLMVIGKVLSRNLDQLFSLVIEILTEPTFPEEELNKVREQIIAQLYLRLEDDAQLARQKFMENLYEGHPYSRDPVGTLASLKVIKKEDIENHYKTYLHRGGLLVGTAGDVTKPKLEDLIHKLVKVLPEGKADPKVRSFEKKLEGIEIILIDKPERTQTQFIIGHPGIDARDRDFFPLNIFVTAFAGHMFQAQYMQEIRVKRGWAYGAYGSVDARRDGGAFYLYTFPKNADTLPALKLSLELLDKAVHGNGVTDESLEFAKKHLSRSFPFLIDIPEKVISQAIVQKLLGRSDDYLEKYVGNIQAVTPAQARAAAKKHLSTKDLEIVMLCTAKEFQKTIGKELLAKSVKVVPFDQL